MTIQNKNGRPSESGKKKSLRNTGTAPRPNHVRRLIKRAAEIGGELEGLNVTQAERDAVLHELLPAAIAHVSAAIRQGRKVRSPVVLCGATVYLSVYMSGMVFIKATPSGRAIVSSRPFAV